MCGFRALRAICDQRAQRMSPYESMQHIHARFRKNGQVVHGVDYATLVGRDAGSVR